MKKLADSIGKLVQNWQGEQFIQKIWELPAKKRENDSKRLRSFEGFPVEKIVQEIKGMSEKEILEALQKNQDAMTNYFLKSEKTSFGIAADIYENLTRYVKRVIENNRIDNRLENILLQNPGIEERFPVIKRLLGEEVEETEKNIEENISHVETIQEETQERIAEVIIETPATTFDQALLTILGNEETDEEEKKAEIIEKFKQLGNRKYMKYPAFYEYLGLHKVIAEKIGKKIDIELVQLLVTQKLLLECHKNSEVEEAEIRDIDENIHNVLSKYTGEKSETKEEKSETPEENFESKWWNNVPGIKVVSTMELFNDGKDRFPKKKTAHTESNGKEEFMQAPTTDPLDLVWEEIGAKDFLSCAGLSYEEIQEAIENETVIPARFFCSPKWKHRAYFTIGEEEQGGGKTVLINIAIMHKDRTFKEKTVYPVIPTGMEINKHPWSGKQSYVIKWLLHEEEKKPTLKKNALENLIDAETKRKLGIK